MVCPFVLPEPPQAQPRHPPVNGFRPNAKMPAPPRPPHGDGTSGLACKKRTYADFFASRCDGARGAPEEMEARAGRAVQRELVNVVARCFEKSAAAGPEQAREDPFFADELKRNVLRFLGDARPETFDAHAWKRLRVERHAARHIDQIRKQTARQKD